MKEEIIKILGKHANIVEEDNKLKCYWYEYGIEKVVNEITEYAQFRIDNSAKSEEDYERGLKDGIKVEKEKYRERRPKHLKCSCCGKSILKHQSMYCNYCVDGEDGDL